MRKQYNSSVPLNSEQRSHFNNAHSVGECLYTCYDRIMSLVTCGRFFRPCLSRVRPALSSPGRAGFRLYSSFEKRPNVAVKRVFTRPASGSSQSSAGGLLGDNGMLIVGIGLLGGSLLYVSIFLEFLDGDSKTRICLHNCSFFLL